MTQQDYITAIKKQQSLIRKLFSSRKRRSEVIDELTQARYQGLVGRFFRPQGEHFKGADDGSVHYICDIRTQSNYAMSDQVDIVLVCRHISRCTQYDGKKETLTGISFYSRVFRFTPADDLDEILAPMWVPKTKGIDEVDELYKGFLDCFLRK